MTRHRLRGAFLLLFVAGSLFAAPRRGAAQDVDLGGRAFLDYYYRLSALDEADEGLHGFTYRRLYLTTDFTLSDAFSGRARLEASESTTGSKGPVPYVKDLYLRWQYAGEHAVTFGVTSPEAFTVSEDVWDYRSLAKTILDFDGVVSSRDFGVKLTGPLVEGGALRYAAMIGNNRASFPEDDRYKRGYLTIAAYPTERLVFTVGGDYAGYDGVVESTLRLSGFAGYVGERFQVGLEPYWARWSTASGSASDEDGVGVSLFGAFDVADGWEAVGRLDRSRLPGGGDDALTTHVVAGLSYTPQPGVRLIPNVIAVVPDGAGKQDVLGRFTIDVRF